MPQATPPDTMDSNSSLKLRVYRICSKMWSGDPKFIWSGEFLCKCSFTMCLPKFLANLGKISTLCDNLYLYWLIVGEKTSNSPNFPLLQNQDNFYYSLHNSMWIILRYCTWRYIVFIWKMLFLPRILTKLFYRMMWAFYYQNIHDHNPAPLHRSV